MKDKSTSNAYLRWEIECVLGVKDPQGVVNILNLYRRGFRLLSALRNGGPSGGMPVPMPLTGAQLVQYPHVKEALAYYALSAQAFSQAYSFLCTLVNRTFRRGVFNAPPDCTATLCRKQLLEADLPQRIIREYFFYNGRHTLRDEFLHIYEYRLAHLYGSELPEMVRPVVVTYGTALNPARCALFMCCLRKWLKVMRPGCKINWRFMASLLCAAGWLTPEEARRKGVVHLLCDLLKTSHLSRLYFYSHFEWKPVADLWIVAHHHK